MKIKIDQIFTSIIFAGLVFTVSCNADSTNYSTGEDDPALAVTEDDLRQVRSLLVEQEQKDIAQGIRKPKPKPKIDESGESEKYIEEI